MPFAYEMKRCQQPLWTDSTPHPQTQDAGSGRRAPAGARPSTPPPGDPRRLSKLDAAVGPRSLGVAERGEVCVSKWWWGGTAA